MNWSWPLDKGSKKIYLRTHSPVSPKSNKLNTVDYLSKIKQTSIFLHVSNLPKQKWYSQNEFDGNGVKKFPYKNKGKYLFINAIRL